jgi:hypothetical protein
VGQGIGAWLGGCSWIGITLPLGRPVWALVNEPSIHFASLGAADGYWLGSLVLPLLLALLAPTLIPRARTAGAELLMVQLGWGLAVIGLAWMPFLDPSDGHLVHWLDFRRLAAFWIWAAPAAAALAAFIAVRRLLKLLDTALPHAGLAARLATVALHFWLPTAGWILLTGILAGPVFPRVLAAVAIPCGAAAAAAFFGDAAPHFHGLGPVGARTWVYGIAATLVAGALVWGSGRPLADQRAAGVLWGRPLATNNIRAWVAPRKLFPRR